MPKKKETQATDINSVLIRKKSKKNSCNARKFEIKKTSHEKEKRQNHFGLLAKKMIRLLLKVLHIKFMVIFKVNEDAANSNSLDSIPKKTRNFIFIILIPYYFLLENLKKKKAIKTIDEDNDIDDLIAPIVKKKLKSPKQKKKLEQKRKEIHKEDSIVEIDIQVPPECTENLNNEPIKETNARKETAKPTGNSVKESQELKKTQEAFKSLQDKYKALREIGIHEANNRYEELKASSEQRFQGF